MDLNFCWLHVPHKPMKQLAIVNGTRITCSSVKTLIKLAPVYGIAIFIGKQKKHVSNILFLFIYFSHPPTEDSLLEYVVHLTNELRRESLPLSDFTIRFFSLAIGFSNRSDSIANLREVFRRSRCPTHCL